MSYTKDIECPYCGDEQDINHDDGYGYSEGVLHNQQCSNCEKTFSFTTAISFDYEVYKAPCLNGGEHDWKPTITAPVKYTKYECSTCGEFREPTPEELEQIIKEREK